MTKQELLQMDETEIINYITQNGIDLETDDEIDDRLNNWYEYARKYLGFSFMQAVEMIMTEEYFEDAHLYYVFR